MTFFKLNDIYPWQKIPWQQLTSRFPNMAHGLLFFGKKGCGKLDFTSHFVAWVLCLDKQPQQACGQCSSCLWLKSNTHPNYLYITVDDEKKAQPSIKIDKIRELQPFIQQTGEGWRVVVIEPADRLNTAAANALLKTLEEPGDRTILILVTEHFLKLPATIRSRLQRYALDRMTYQQAYSYVKEQLPHEAQIDLKLALGNGMPLEALKEHVWLTYRQEFLEDWVKIVKHKDKPMQYATKWTKTLSFYDFQTMLEYLLADIICVKLQQHIKNIDLDFSEIVRFYSLEQLFHLHEQVQKNKQLNRQNVQTNLMLDQLFTLFMNINGE